MAATCSARSLGRKLNVVLVNPQIPQNTGSIGRTCLAFGARLVRSVAHLPFPPLPLDHHDLPNQCQHLVGPYGFKLDDKSLLRAGLDYWPYVELKEHQGSYHTHTPSLSIRPGIS